MANHSWEALNNPVLKREQYLKTNSYIGLTLLKNVNMTVTM